MADIIFDNTNARVFAVCDSFWVQGSDLIIDSTARRKPGTVGGGFRRALVHTQGDSLTINYNDDYSAGVTLNGPLKIVGDVSMDLNIQTISATHPGTKTTHETINLGTLVATLRAQILNLEARVAKLESK